MPKQPREVSILMVDDDRDKTRAYASHIVGYIVKAKIGEDFQQLIALLQPYWRIVAMQTNP